MAESSQTCASESSLSAFSAAASSSERAGIDFSSIKFIPNAPEMSTEFSVRYAPFFISVKFYNCIEQ